MESKTRLIKNTHNSLHTSPLSHHTSHLSAPISQNGITLVALVVTIIVLLILAGVTIMSLLSDEGIFEKAERAAYETRKARAEEQIGMVNLQAQAQKALNGSLTAEDYFEIVKDNGLISDSTIGGDNIQDKGENAEGNHVYEVTTEEGDVFEVIIDDEGNVETEYQGTVDGLPPRISGIETSKTTNSITVKVTVNRLEGGEISYYIKKQGEEYPKDPTHTTKETSYKFEGLEQNVIYDIKVVAENSKGSDEEETSEITSELATGTISQKGETQWSNGEASIELETTETGYTIQYKINENTQWETYEGAITGLHHNDEVVARLWDGNNGSGETVITIVDKEKPMIDKFEVEFFDTGSITTQIEAIDNQSGIKKYQFEYKLSTSNEYITLDTIETAEISYTYKYMGLADATSYNLRVIVYDNADNQAISSSITQVTEKANVAPTVPTVLFSSKTTNTIKCNAMSIDDNEDQLTYRLYVSTSENSGFTEVAVSQPTASGTQVSLQATELNQYTKYYYYVTVTDGEETVKSAANSERTYCPGNTIICSTQICSSGSNRRCTKCNGTGTISEPCNRCDGEKQLWKCRNCGLMTSSKGYGCYKCDGNSFTLENCYECGGTGVETSRCNTCRGAGTIMSSCQHGLYNSHRYCSHYNNTTLIVHYYCEHNMNGQQHD